MAPTVLAGRARRGADLLAGSLEQVPLAPQYPFEKAAAGVLQVPERQKKDWKFRCFASQEPLRTALYSPAEVPPNRRVRERDS